MKENVMELVVPDVWDTYYAASNMLSLISLSLGDDSPLRLEVGCKDSRAKDKERYAKNIIFTCENSTDPEYKLTRWVVRVFEPEKDRRKMDSRTAAKKCVTIGMRLAQEFCEEHLE